VTELEERLSRELKELSERAQPGLIRPLREPRARRRPRAVRWLAPVAAVAAVLAVIAGVSMIGRPGGRVPPPVATRAPMPRYYVTVWQTYAASNNGRALPTYAVVHDSATGAALATVRVPTLTDSQGATQGPSITAAGDDRTFVIMEQSDTARVSRFYLLRVAPNGRSATLSRLPVSVPAYLAQTDVALSPDGTRLAMDVQDCSATAQSCTYTGIRVVTIATGAVSTWTTRANGSPFNVSWAGNERVAFQWQAGSRTPPPGQHTGYRLLSLTGAGRNLMASLPIGSPRPEPTQYVPAALVTADGNTVVTSTVQNIPDGDGRYTVVAKVIELSARTGRLLRVLHTATVRNATGGQSGTTGQLDQECNVLSLAPSDGIQVLVACFAVGRVDGDQFTPLPGLPSPSSSGISGQQAVAW
jgi:hypothetical protein